MKRKNPTMKRGRKPGISYKVKIDGNKLATIRVAKNYSQSELTKAINKRFGIYMSRNLIGEIENHNMVSKKYLGRICEVLKISEESLK